MKHLKRKDSAQYEQIFVSNDENSMKDIVIENDDSFTTDSSTGTLEQYRMNSPIPKYLIVKCNLPLTLVEHSSFHEFLKERNMKWEPISSKNLKNDAIPTYLNKVNKIIRGH